MKPALLNNLKKAFRYFKHYGFREFFIRLREKDESVAISYEKYANMHQVTEKELNRQAEECHRWANAPWFIGIVLGDGYEIMHKELGKQSYNYWELYDVRDCEGLQSAIKSERGNKYLFFMEKGDMLVHSALYEVARAILFPEKTHQSGLHWEAVGVPDLLYTDEDKIREDGRLCDPQLKPDFSLHMLQEVCYIRHLLVVSVALASAAWDEMKALENSEVIEPDFLETFVRVCAEKAEMIFHLPKVLCHVQEKKTEETTADRQKPIVGVEKGYMASPLHSGRKYPFVVEKASKQADRKKPLISIIIPNKDQQELLDNCIRSIGKSTYRNFEIIIVENNSTDRDIFDYYDILTHSNLFSNRTGETCIGRQESQTRGGGQGSIQVVVWNGDGQFNYSAINNYGASVARGEYLLFLNNDIELITPDWMEKLLANCCQQDVAVVGAKLLYPDDTVQHAGIVVGIGGHARGVAANMCVGLPRDAEGYMNRASIRQNLSAVTAACMMMKKQVFDEIGGFTEKLAVAFNDVDLCLKARKAGYLIVYDPYVEAYHYESKSRGEEDTPEKVRRFQEEIEYMRTKWGDILKVGDPYYHPDLTRYRTDYSLRGRR